MKLKCTCIAARDFTKINVVKRGSLFATWGLNEPEQTLT